MFLGEIDEEHHEDTTQSCHQRIYLQSVVARQGFDACARTKDEEDIEDIAAYDIAESNIAVLLEYCHTRADPALRFGDQLFHLLRSAPSVFQKTL